MSESKPLFTAEQRELAKKLFCSELTADESEQFIVICERTGLDPFTKQIYARAQSINRAKPNEAPKWGKTLVVITSIDGLRTLAEKTGEYRGQTPPAWFYKNGEENSPTWHDHYLGIGRAKTAAPEAAKVGVYREGFKEALIAIATYESFVQYQGKGAEARPTSFWLKMPDVQLLKCAEAQALRKAFPLVLSGLLIEEEVKDDDLTDEERAEIAKQQAAKTEAAAPKRAAKSNPSKKQQEEQKPNPEAEIDEVTKQAQAQASQKPAAPAPTQPARTGAGEESPLGDDPQPQEPVAPQEPEQTGPAAYKIATVNHPKYAGKSLGEIGTKGLVNLKAAFFDKHKDQIEKDPKKSQEWGIILKFITDNPQG